MPLYDYKCLKCGKIFEIEQKISDKPLEKCPACPGKVKRIISSNIGVVFKGSGFHTTDYRKEPKPTPPKPAKKEAKKQKSEK
jgi:putative FmdB family regulatory protein